MAAGWIPKGGEMAVERVEVSWGAKKERRVDGGRTWVMDEDEAEKEGRMRGLIAREEDVDGEEEEMAWERRARARAAGSASERTSVVGEGWEA